MSNLIGQSLGRYHILEQLGEGGMATVYKAYDTRLERDVAVKIIRRESFPPDQLERILKRFEREAKALAKLSHPNVVGVIDYGDYEGSPYLVMEFLPSGTLKQRLGKPIPWPEAVRLLLPIARALQFAHGQGIVHRDIKPSNILITESGEPMLADFGIAKILESGETATLTGTGVGIGTPEYMSPEQWTGNVTTQSDIYSLGIVFYEMITGRKPYTADTPAAVLLMQANEPLPRPCQFVRGLPEGVERLLLKALARRPEDRFHDMGAFADAMERLSAGLPDKSSAASARTEIVAGKTPPAAHAAPAIDEGATRDGVPASPADAPSWRTRWFGAPKSNLRRAWMIGIPAVIVCLCLSMAAGAGAAGLGAMSLGWFGGEKSPAAVPTAPAAPISTQKPSLTPSPIFTIMPTFTKTPFHNIIVTQYPLENFSLPNETLYSIGFQGEGICKISAQSLKIIQCRTTSLFNNTLLAWNVFRKEIYISAINGDVISIISPETLYELGLYTNDIGWNTTSTEVSLDGRYVFLSSMNGGEDNFRRITSVDTETRHTFASIKIVHTYGNIFLTQSTNGKNVFVSWDSNLDIYMTPDLEFVEQIQGIFDTAGRLISLPDGHSFLLAQDNRFIVWDFNTRQTTAEIDLPGVSIYSRMLLARDKSRIWIMGENILYELPLPIINDDYTAIQLAATPCGFSESYGNSMLYIALGNSEIVIYDYSKAMLSQSIINIQNIMDILALPGIQ
jgi:serine/threonine protein kinase